jgi:hypothetical protein
MIASGIRPLSQPPRNAPGSRPAPRSRVKTRGIAPVRRCSATLTTPVRVKLIRLMAVA